MIVLGLTVAIDRALAGLNLDLSIGILILGCCTLCYGIGFIDGQYSEARRVWQLQDDFTNMLRDYYRGAEHLSDELDRLHEALITARKKTD
jgi:hypothetical protein